MADSNHKEASQKTDSKGSDSVAARGDDMNRATPVVVSLIALLNKLDYEALIVDHDDPHATEMPHDAFGGLEFVSGFSGTWGKAVVTRDSAALWTDSRYFLQAEKQLVAPWELMRFGEKGVPDLTDYLSSKKVKRVGVDATTTSQKLLDYYRKCLPGVEFVELYANPLYELWSTARPSLPLTPVRLYPERFTGLCTRLKLERVREELDKAGADVLAVSLLDEVVYLLNLRGADSDVSPFFYAYVVVDKTSATVFIDERKLTPEVKEYLSANSISVRGYDDLSAFLKQLDHSKFGKPVGDPLKLWVSPNASVAICSSFLSGATAEHPRELLKENTPLSLMKAVKNEVELEGMKEAHIVDALALAHFFGAVNKMKEEGTLWNETEYSLGCLSTKFRSEQEGYTGVSFDPISSIGPNGAVVHYHPDEKKSSKIGPAMYLLDSGGQYLGGTTDVTRTVHFGTPTAEEKESYTHVLKGHLALRHAVFPEKTPGQTLDILARQYLWKSGRNYYHGTGHGVGAYLNVHEGPVGVSGLRRSPTGEVSVVYLEPGMCVSNEPGYYKSGDYGVRIENVVYVTPANKVRSRDSTEFFTFADLTLVPYCKELIDLDLLSAEEVRWINEYHALIADILIPRLEKQLPLGFTAPITFLREAAVPLVK